MADIIKQITLTSLGSNAGPLFDVYYSLDCISYTQSVDGNDVSLPFVGSSVNVTIPDTTTCIKLVNLSDVCGMNNYVEYIGGGTTTTTTQPPIEYWNVSYCDGDTGSLNIIHDTYAVISAGVVTKTVIGDRCVYVESPYVGIPPVSINTQNIVYTNCEGCVPATTTTTTTLQPTTTTTTAAPTFEYWSGSYCNNGNQVPLLLRATSSLSSGDVVNFGSIDPANCTTLTNKWLGTPPFVYLSINRLYTNCFDCQGITTTTTTTTTTEAIKYTYLRYDVDTNTCGTSNPIPLWSYLNFTSGFYKIESDPTLYYLQVQAHTDYTFQFLSATPDSCTPITTTTTTSTTTTTLQPGYFRALSCANLTTQVYSTLLAAGTFNSGDRVLVEGLPYVIDGFTTTLPEATYTFTATGEIGCPATTTTTTTLPPALTVTNGSVTCSGTTGGWRSSFSGGSGTYTNVAYGTSQANAIDWLDGSGTGDGVMHTLMLGETYYDWTNVSNGTWYVAVKDSLGNQSVQNTPVVVNCTTTTTTTTAAPTTTTTTTTTSTTTTTTAAGVQFGISLTQTYGNTSLACAGTITGVVYQPPIYGNTPANGAQLYTDSAMQNTWTPASGAGIYLMQFGGSDKWAVFVGSTGVISGVTSCSGVTTTTTSTTTTTTAAPTTTTTTASGGTASFYIVNNFFSGTITDVTVNGVSITGASFPLAVGDGTVGTTTQVGTNETVRVYFDSVSPSPSNIQVTDTALNYQCGVVAGTSNELFTNVVIGSGQTVDVLAFDGACP